MKADFSEEYKIRVATSLWRLSGHMKETIDLLAPVEMKQLGGAGNKINQIVLGEVDSYVRPEAGLGFWDLAAPEVLVRAMGGLCTDMKGNRLVYKGNNQVIPAFAVGKT